ncbi:MAG: Uma2 family endonuclease [Methylomicrobium sp.]
MLWQEVCENSSLKNLPFKIELNVQGQLLMTPVKVNHSIIQGKIIGLLYRHSRRAGEALAECAIKTRDGTKVADVAWASPKILNIIQMEAECSIAPEICVEVMSMSNTPTEMAQKRALYFECGAQEVWICDHQGHVEFFSAQGKIERSELVSNFPNQV